MENESRLITAIAWPSDQVQIMDSVVGTVTHLTLTENDIVYHVDYVIDGMITQTTCYGSQITNKSCV